jgi:alkylated DNA repair dioxygenase AlkB
MARASSTAAASAAPPHGFRYADEFVSPADEAALVAEIARLPLANAQYKEWTANRRVVSYGGRYDFGRNELAPAAPIPPFLHALRDSAAAFADLRAADLTHALIAEYSAGTQLGWHRDVPEFEHVVGISLLAPARLRLRPFPHTPGSGARTLKIELAPRSIYRLSGAARWGWQHAISPTPSLRYSITFRTLRRSAARS